MSNQNGTKLISLAELLAAESVLAALVGMMHRDYEQNGRGWKRDIMQKHVNDRAALIAARNVLIDYAEAANGHEA